LNGIPGVSIRFAMTDLITQLLTANKSPVEVKVFGPDLKQLSLLTDQAEKIMKQVSGIRDVNIEVDDASPVKSEPQSAAAPPPATTWRPPKMKSILPYSF